MANKKQRKLNETPRCEALDSREISCTTKTVIAECSCLKSKCFHYRQSRPDRVSGLLLVLGYPVVLFGVLAVADQLGESLVVGDNDELEVLLRFPILHDPGKADKIWVSSLSSTVLH